MDESASGPAVLISAATSAEVQGHSSFNSWLSGFASTPVPESKKADDYSLNLAKLKAAKSNREPVLELEANNSGDWA